MKGRGVMYELELVKVTMKLMVGVLVALALVWAFSACVVEAELRGDRGAEEGKADAAVNGGNSNVPPEAAGHGRGR